MHRHASIPSESDVESDWVNDKDFESEPTPEPRERRNGPPLYSTNSSKLMSFARHHLFLLDVTPSLGFFLVLPLPISSFSIVDRCRARFLLARSDSYQQADSLHTDTSIALLTVESGIGHGLAERMPFESAIRVSFTGTNKTNKARSQDHEGTSR